MKDVREFFQEVYHALQQGVELVAAAVISGGGSAPRASGARMIIYADGQLSGTIGGGAAEAGVIRTAQRLFESKGAAVNSHTLQQSDSAERVGLICGGGMKVLLEHIAVNDTNISLYEFINTKNNASLPLSLFAKVSERGEFCLVERAVKTSEGEWAGSSQLQHELQKMLDCGTVTSSGSALFEMKMSTYVVEQVDPPETVYLVGGGHVSKEIAVLTKMIGFRTIVFDNRVEFANSQRFPDADEIHVRPGYDGLFEGYSIGTASYIVIVTQGHHFDKKVLTQALRTESGYIGMIGSRRKRETIYRALIKEGFQTREFERVSCPIGLPIAAETPAEIAVSVAAQLIQHRAGRDDDG